MYLCLLLTIFISWNASFHLCHLTAYIFFCLCVHVTCENRQRSPVLFSQIWLRSFNHGWKFRCNFKFHFYFICSVLQRCVPKDILSVVEIARKNNINLEEIINSTAIPLLPNAVKNLKILAEFEVVSSVATTRILFYFNIKNSYRRKFIVTTLQVERSTEPRRQKRSTEEKIKWRLTISQNTPKTIIRLKNIQCIQFIYYFYF